VRTGPPAALSLGRYPRGQGEMARGGTGSMSEGQEPWLEALRRECEAAPSLAGALQACVRGLRRALPHFNWVGAYMVAGGDLVLGPWTGPEATEHVRIPIGTGVCGAAAASGRTEVVDDVRADPRYLACFLHTRSELVVPITRGGRVYGEIDVDSDRTAAFSPAEVGAVEALCQVLARRAEAEGHDFHVPGAAG
jgi:L-methionine (R)-S-oxide reductase